jgi:hypothetical protein
LIGCVKIRAKLDLFPISSSSMLASWRGCARSRRQRGWPRRRRWRKQKNLRVRGKGVPAPKKMRPLADVRGMSGTSSDRRKRSLGQCKVTRCAGACRPRAGWMAVQPAVEQSEVETHIVFYFLLTCFLFLFFGFLASLNDYITWFKGPSKA